MGPKGNKSKKSANKGQGRSVQKSDLAAADSSTNTGATTVITCRTLEEDEVTRCSLPATDGYPEHDRCRLHHKQYRTLTAKYKEASEIVDEVKGGNEIPTKDEIAHYKDAHGTLEKARWMRKYLEAIRVEKTGREIHTRRFFGKADDGHKIRVNLLAKRMVEAVEILDALQAHAYYLRNADDPAHDSLRRFQSSPLPTDGQDIPKNLLESKSIINTVQTTQIKPSLPRRALSATQADQAEDVDLIDSDHRAQKQKLLEAFRPYIDSAFARRLINPADSESQDPKLRRFATIIHLAEKQYALRFILHDPILSLKATDKVSFKDLILDDDFSMEDAARFLDMFTSRMGLGLLWYKDSIVEALAILPRDGKIRSTANVGDPKDRYKVLGGWVFTRTYPGQFSDEGWTVLLKALQPPANVENRFVRLCNSFDDIISFLSFGAFGFVPPPTFTEGELYDQYSSSITRNHLSLCGIIVTDMISGVPFFSVLSGPIPTQQPSKTPGCITWLEMEKRSYMFGAVRNEPDAFTEAFFNEIRARPDLFQGLTRSETDPGRHVETFGAHELEGEGLLPWQTRLRTFEAPRASFQRRPQGRGTWKVEVSAMDLLYSTTKVHGYLAGPRPDGMRYQ